MDRCIGRCIYIQRECVQVYMVPCEPSAIPTTGSASRAPPTSSAKANLGAAAGLGEPRNGRRAPDAGRGRGRGG